MNEPVDFSTATSARESVRRVAAAIDAGLRSLEPGQVWRLQVDPATRVDCVLRVFAVLVCEYGWAPEKLAQIMHLDTTPAVRDYVWRWVANVHTYN